MSSATVAAPISLKRTIRSPMRSRRQGHWPMVDRLRSSTSTITTRPLIGLVLIDRSRMSYAALSSLPNSAGGNTASTTVTSTAPTPHRNTRRRRVGRAFGNLATVVRLPHGNVDAPIAGLWGFIGGVDQRIEFADRRGFDGRAIEAGGDEEISNHHRPLQPE